MSASSESTGAHCERPIAVLVGGIAVILDSTIVSVALRQLADELNVGVSTIQWVSTAYLLALGVVIPTVGWLQSRLGAKRLWMVALTVFLLGSVLCSFAWNAESLIAFRVVQGIGGGAMMPLMTTMMMQAAGGQNLGRLMSVVALPTAIGPILGPVIGGLILGLGDWRWLFLVNVPLCVAGLVLAWRMISGGRAGPVASGSTWSGCCCCPRRWSACSGDCPTWRGRAASVIPTSSYRWSAVLCSCSGSCSGRCAAAAMRWSTWRCCAHRPTWSATALLFLSGAALYGAMLLLPLYFQELRGTDALGAGLLLIPQGVGSLISRTVAARLMDRLSARRWP